MLFHSSSALRCAQISCPTFREPGDVASLPGWRAKGLELGAPRARRLTPGRSRLPFAQGRGRVGALPHLLVELRHAGAPGTCSDGFQGLGVRLVVDEGLRRNQSGAAHRRTRRSPTWRYAFGWTRRCSSFDAWRGPRAGRATCAIVLHALEELTRNPRAPNHGRVGVLHAAGRAG